MRRQDKKKNMEKVNKLFQQRINEEKFSWDGKYTNEEEVDENIAIFGDDMEMKEEISKEEQWFSDVDSDRVTSKPEN